MEGMENSADSFPRSGSWVLKLKCSAKAASDCAAQDETLQKAGRAVKHSVAHAAPKGSEERLGSVPLGEPRVFERRQITVHEDLGPPGNVKQCQAGVWMVSGRMRISQVAAADQVPVCMYCIYIVVRERAVQAGERAHTTLRTLWGRLTIVHRFVWLLWA